MAPQVIILINDTNVSFKLNPFACDRYSCVKSRKTSVYQKWIFITSKSKYKRDTATVLKRILV